MRFRSPQPFGHPERYSPRPSLPFGGCKATCATTDVLARRLPPKGIAIVLTEEPGAQPNWVAAAGMMETVLTDKFSEKVAELRKTDPLVDWTGVDKGHAEFRRVVKFLSAATG